MRAKNTAKTLPLTGIEPLNLGLSDIDIEITDKQYHSSYGMKSIISIILYFLTHVSNIYSYHVSLYKWPSDGIVCYEG